MLLRPAARPGRDAASTTWSPTTPSRTTPAPSRSCSSASPRRSWWPRRRARASSPTCSASRRSASSPVEDGATLELGGRTLRFIHFPWVHWPETMLTWLEQDRILFSCDLFGAHLAAGDLAEPDACLAMEAAKRYYAEIMMPFRNVDRGTTCRRSRTCRSSIICPSHGPVHRRPQAHPRRLPRLARRRAEEPRRHRLRLDARQHEADGAAPRRGAGRARRAGGPVQPRHHRPRQAGHRPGGRRHHRAGLADRDRRRPPAGRQRRLRRQPAQAHGPLRRGRGLVQLGRQDGRPAHRPDAAAQARAARAGRGEGPARRPRTSPRSTGWRPPSRRSTRRCGAPEEAPEGDEARGRRPRASFVAPGQPAGRRGCR